MANNKTMSVKSIVVKAVVGVVIVALLTGAMILLNNSDPENQGQNNGAVAETLVEVYRGDTQNAVRIDIYTQTPFSLYKNAESEWTMEGMEGIKVRAAYADALCKSMTNISSPMLIKENAEDLSQYGLDKPYAQLKITYSDSEQAMNIGNVSGEYYYFALNGENDVYIVSAKDLSMVFMDSIRYLDTYITNVDANTIVAVEYGNVAVKKIGEYWFETSPYARLADDAAVKTRLLSDISSIDADGIVKKSENLTQATNSVAIKLSDGEVIEFFVYPGEAGYNYVVKDDSGYAYTVKTGVLEFLNITGFELITKYVAPIPLNEVKKLEMVSPSGKRVITIDAPESEAPVFYLDGEEAKEDSVRDFYADLVSLTFKGEGIASGAAEYAIIFTHTDNTKTDIRFSPITETDYAVSIDGKTQFTIAKKSVTDVFAAIRNIETI